MKFIRIFASKPHPENCFWAALSAAAWERTCLSGAEKTEATSCRGIDSAVLRLPKSARCKGNDKHEQNDSRTQNTTKHITDDFEDSCG